MAERAGFEPARELLAPKPLSRRPRYDHFGTSPHRRERQTKYATLSQRATGEFPLQIGRSRTKNNIGSFTHVS
jgi:hypothetical protein